MSWIQHDPRVIRGKIQLPKPHSVGGGGEKIAMTVLATAYKNPPLVFDTYDCDKRPKEEPQGGEITPPHDDSDHTGDRLQESAARHWCLRYARSEEMKARRRLVGDNGGIKFQGKIAMVRDDRCVNTITNVLKDNLILESYE